MRHPLIATRIFGVPLLTERSYADVAVSALADDLGIAPIATPEQMAAQHRPTRYAAVYAESGVAVVPVVGALVHRAGASASASGMQGYAGTQDLLMALAADPKVRGIILDLDTPGGEVGGVQELGEAIKEVGKDKPIWALANPLAASAGYWIAASASKILATPFARVGSIGVVTMHIDASKAAEKRGIAVSFVHAGKHKVAGHQFAPLDDETRARMQALIDDTYDAFVSHVAESRGMDEKAIRATEAMVYSAKEALELKLVDGISNLGQAIEQMQSHLGSRSRPVNIQRTGTMDQAAIDAARNEGIATGRAEERARFGAILGHANASGKGKLALTLASTTDLTVEAAAAVLASAASEAPVEPAAPVITAPKPNEPPKSDAQSTSDALAHLRATSPKVAGEVEADAKDARRAEIAARFGGKKTAA